MMASLFAGIDLHSNNLMVGIVDQSGQRLKHPSWDRSMRKGRDPREIFVGTGTPPLREQVFVFC